VKREEEKEKKKEKNREKETLGAMSLFYSC
jgi:hypothetical protein